MTRSRFGSAVPSHIGDHPVAFADHVEHLRQFGGKIELLCAQAALAA